MILSKIICAIALSYCAYHAACIVRALRGESAARKTRERPRPGQSRALPSLVSLLSLSRTLEVCHDGN